MSRRVFKDENHRGLMHFACTYTSWYFLIYDDEYGRVRYDDMTLFHIKMTFMYWMSWFITKTIYFSKDTTLVEVNDDERMKTNTYILLSLTYERCTGLCHEEYLKMKIIGVSCILRVHIHRDTSSFMMMSTDAYAMMMMIMPCMKLNGLLTSERRYGLLAQLCWVRGWEPSGDLHSHLWVV